METGRCRSCGSPAGTERRARGFVFVGQSVALLLCLLGSANSLGAMANGWAVGKRKLWHHGLPERAHIFHADRCARTPPLQPFRGSP